MSKNGDMKKLRRNLIFEILAIVLVEISCISQMEVFCSAVKLSVIIGYCILGVMGLSLILLVVFKYRRQYTDAEKQDIA